MPETTYQRIKGELKTGDIVLFSGKSGFSRTIKYFTTSVWTHVGMVLEVPGHEGPLVWESLRIGEIEDVVDQRLKSGVQLLSLCERVVRSYDAIAVRQLSHPVDSAMLDAALRFRLEVRDRPYEQNVFEVVRAAWDGPFGLNTEDLSSLFCSELVAASYQRMGLLLPHEDGGAPSNEYTPAYFSRRGRLDLRGKWSLGPEILVNAG